MKKLHIIALGAACILAVGAGGYGLQSYIQETRNAEQTVEDTVDAKIQELKDYAGQYTEDSIVLSDTTKDQAEQIAESLGAKVRTTSDGSYATLYLPEGTSIEDVYSDEDNEAWIGEMEPDYYVYASSVDANGRDLTAVRPMGEVTDTGYDQQTYLDYLDLQDTWSKTKGSGVTIAVIDTGIDTDNSEFSGRISSKSYYASEDKVVQDYGMDIIEDENGHGTEVAGIMAAAMDGNGITGIAPEAELLVIKCDCDESGQFVRSSDLVFGLAYAIEADADVINMSFATDFDSFSKYTSLAVDSDIICVASAGNSGTSSLNYPAADPNVIGVGALDADSWELAEYSNYGENSDIVAPGTAYTTTLDGYRYKTGTSMASPIVAGVIALYLSEHPNTEFTTVSELLKASSIDLGVLGEDWTYGFGALDAEELIFGETGTITYEMLTDEVKNQTQLFVKGHTLQYMAEPERDNMVLDGWYFDQECTQECEYYTEYFSEDTTLYANWEYEDESTVYSYITKSDDTVEITSYNGKRRYLTVPSTIEGKNVTSIGERAFANNSRISKITLPNTLTNISQMAFYNCQKLLSIEIPESVQTIGAKAFYGDVRLSYVGINVNGALSSVGEQAFAQCGITSFSIPANLTELGTGVFAGSASLRKITVASGNSSYQLKNNALYDKAGTTLLYYPAGIAGPYTVEDGTTTIGANAFDRSKATEVTLPEGLISIGDSAFVSSYLRRITLPDSLNSMGVAAFENCSYLASVDYGECYLTSIPSCAFRGCYRLNSFTIPALVSEIGEDAFCYSGLNVIIFNDGLTKIDNYAFAFTSLQTITLPAALTEIGNSAFYYCQALSQITFPEDAKIQKIGNFAFYSCIRLQQLDMPDSLTSLGERAFFDSGLQSVKVGSGLTDIGRGTFSGCQQLAEIQVSSENPNYSAVDGVLLNKDGTELMMYPAAKTGVYIFPSTVIKVDDYAFANAKSLQEVQMNRGLTEICDDAFVNCSAMQTPVLPDTLQTIGTNAFKNCTSMNQTMTIPKSVISIGYRAFSLDYNLTEIIIESDSSLSRLGYGAFAYCGITDFTVPESVRTMGQEVFTGCPNLVTVTFEGESQLINLAAWTFSGADSLRRITFEDGSHLEQIEARACENLKKLDTLNLSGCDSLVKIGNYAFRNCSALTKVTMPSQLQEIGRFAFQGCSLLSSIQLPETVDFIGRYAFADTNKMNVYFEASVLPSNLEEYWDYGIAGYHVGFSESVISGDWTYAVTSDGKAAITGYSGSDSDIVLTTIDGYEIVSISGGVFKNNTTLKSIILPDTLTGIYDSVFQGTTKLQSISIPAGVVVIGSEAFRDSGIEEVNFALDSQLYSLGRYAFAGTKNLISMELPAEVKTVQDHAFWQSGIQSLTFASDDNLAEIGRYAFAESGLKSITLPGSVTKIDYYAFSKTSSLSEVTLGTAADLQIMGNAFYQAGMTDITLPENVEYLGEVCFGSCPNLTSINVDPANTHYASVDGVLFDKEETRLIACPTGKTGSYTIASTVKTFAVGAFEGSKLSEVVMPEDSQLMAICYRAFYNCDNLTCISIPASVQSIGNYAFAGCDSLTSVEIDENSNMGGIYKSAFYNCTKLQNIMIPASVKEIGAYAFYGTDALTELEMQEGSTLTIIDDYAFSGSGITAFEMPEQLTEIGDSAFLGAKLGYLTVNNVIQSIGDYAFADCGLADTTTLVFPESVNYMGYGMLRGADAVTNLTIPFTGSYLGDNTHFGSIFAVDNSRVMVENLTILHGNIVPDKCFCDCVALENVILPSEITMIGNQAFECAGDPYDADNEKPERRFSIVLPDQLVSIGDRAFSYAGICSINLPESLEEIGDSAFWGAPFLTEINIPKNVQKIGSGAFSDCDSLVSLNVDSDNPNFVAYDSILYAKSDMSIVYVPAGLTGTVTIPEGVTEIPSYAFSGSSVKEIILSDTVDTIDDRAFYRAHKLEHIEIPDSVTSIGERAFDECYALTDISLPDSITLLGWLVFDHCTGLKSISWPNGISSIPYGTFYYCTSLEQIEIPESVTTIGQKAFYCCKSLKTITIPTNVQTMETPFGGCTSLTAFIVEEGNQYFQAIDGILYNKSCTQIVGVPGAISGEVKIADGVTKLGDDLFAYCTGITSIVLPDSVQSVGWSCFNGCTNLSEVDLGNGINSIGHNVLMDTAYANNESNWKNGVLYVGNYALETKGSVTNLIISDGTKVLAEYLAIGIHDTLEHVWIPDSVEYMGSHLFIVCDKLKTVRMSSSLKSTSTLWSPEDTQVKSLDFSEYSGIRATIEQKSVLYLKGSSIEGSTISPGPCTIIASVPYSSGMKITGSNLQKLIITTTDNMDTYFLSSIPSSTKIYCYVNEFNGWPAGWNQGNSTYYKDEWHLATFYVNDSIVTMDAIVNGNLVQAPSTAEILEYLWSGENFVGWDTNGDGEVDELPTLLDQDLKAVAIIGKDIEEITISGQNTMRIFATQQLKATFSPEAYTSDDTLTWSSSDESIATVDASGNVTAQKNGTVTITATLASDNSISDTFEITVSAEQGIYLDEISGSLKTGETLTLNPVLVMEDGDTETSNWTSSDDSIATVSDGVITGVAPGTAVIRIVHGAYSAEYTVTVLQPLENITLSGDSNVNVGEDICLTVGYYPENTTDSKVTTWSSSDSTIAAVSADGKVTGIAPGIATITAKCQDKTASMEITVYAPLQWIKLNTSTGTMRLDRTKQLEVIYEPENTTDSKASSWASSNPDVASVTDTGLVTACKRGSAVITATVGTHTASYNVTVIGLRDEATGITVTNANDTAMADGMALAVNEVTKEQTEENYDDALNQIAEAAGDGNINNIETTIYDLTLSEDGNIVQPETAVDVDIPVTNIDSTASVYRLEDDGTVTDMSASVENGSVSFTTEHFSVYAVVYRTHYYVPVITPASCTEEGCTTYTCDVCGNSYITDKVGSLGHDYQLVTTEPTCVDDGVTAYICTRCGDSYTVNTTAAFGHTMGEWETVKSPDCTNQGSRMRKCKVCGYTETENLEATGHDWEDSYTVDIEPTCTNEGSESIHCKNCDAVTDSRTLAKKAHTLGTWTVVSNATCLTEGTEERNCEYCDYKESRTISALGHDYQAAVVKPTCTEDGYTIYTCSRCKDTYTADVIPALGHQFTNYVYNNDETYTADGTETAICDNDCGTTDTRTVTGTKKPYLATPALGSVSNVAGGVKVTWGVVSGAVNYKVYYKTAGSSWKTAGYTTGTSYTVTGLAFNTKYYFTVRCFTSDGKTATSSCNTTGKSITYTANIKPTLANASTGITLKWSKVSGATGYYVYRKTGSGSYSRIKTITSASTVSYTDTAVKSNNGTLYTYAVRAYKGSVAGTFTAVNVNRLTGISISSVTNSAAGKATVKWIKNAKASGYQIQYSTSGTFASGNKVVTSTGATTVAKTLTGLTKGKIYYVRIRAYRGSSYSPWSSVKSVKISK